jgi:hypothetical protein
MNTHRPLAARLLAAAMLIAPLSAQAQSSVTKKVDGHDRYNVGRGAYLPQGAGKLYTSLTLGDDWPSDPRQAAVAAWFEQDRRLLNLKAQTDFNLFTLSNPHFRDQLAKYYGTRVPIVTVQKPDGQILLNITGKSMPGTSRELADQIDDALEGLYAAPSFPGQGVQTPIEQEDCPPDGPCPYRPVVPVDVQPQIPEVLPPSRVAQGVAMVVVLLLLVILAIVGAAIWGKKPRDSTGLF